MKTYRERFEEKLRLAEAIIEDARGGMTDEHWDLFSSPSKQMGLNPSRAIDEEFREHFSKYLTHYLLELEDIEAGHFRPEEIKRETILRNRWGERME